MEGARYLEDGRLTIFKRSGVFYARIRLPSQKYFWRTLKTTDEATAIRAGRKLLFQVEERAEIGLPPKSKLFSAVIDDYVRFRERDHHHGRTSDGMLRQIVRVAKFWARSALDSKAERA
jgi:integrase